MTIEIFERDLFLADDKFTFVQCGSADFALGKGIALQFNRRYDVKSRLKLAYGSGKVGEALYTPRVYTLITKQIVWGKPTYDTMRTALESLRENMRADDIKHLAMPAIGCGLDRLNFERVLENIKEVFRNEEVVIEIYLPKQERSTE